MQLNIINLVVCALIALSEAFLFCYFGVMTTKSLSKYVDSIYEVHWYDIPVPLQKRLVVIMANLQRPQEYQGFGMMALNLVTFVKVKFYNYKNIFFKFNIESYQDGVFLLCGIQSFK